MSKEIILVLLVSLFSLESLCQIESIYALKSPSEIIIDGVLNEREWTNANKCKIKIDNDWSIAVKYFQDADKIYFSFSNLKLNDSTEFYPEVLIDSKNDKSNGWDQNDWWFHSSYSNCENKGRNSDYSTCKVGQKEGWGANNFGHYETQNIEMAIDKSLIGVQKGDLIGIAFDVTDTQNKWYFFPEKSSINSPETWMTIKL